MYYREDKSGQILQEGINEAGGMSSWIAAATSYSTNNRIMVPFYVYYSMFGFQRIGDLAWAAGDMQARGFLLGGTSGRTTLNGEGLQHEDGHSHILASTIPNCISYDPTFAHEVGVILHHGLVRMVEKQDNVYFYLTLLNENYPQPGLEVGTEEQIIKGMYLLQQGTAASAKGKPGPSVNLLGSGTILRESVAAKKLLEEDWGVAANVWSCPSFNELARDGQDCERFNLLHPTEKAQRVPFVTKQLAVSHAGPVIASTDYMKNYAEQIRAFMPKGRNVQGARHRRLRPQRFPQQAARALRDQPPLHRRRRAQGPGRRGLGADGEGRRGDQEVRARHQRRQGQPALRLSPPRRQQERTTGDKQMALVDVKVPDIGDFAEVEVIELLVKVGDRVLAEQSLITVESDKASMEIPSSTAGVVRELKIKLGDKVKEGSVLLVLEADAGQAGQSEPAPPSQAGRSGPACITGSCANCGGRGAGRRTRRVAGGIGADRHRDPGYWRLQRGHSGYRSEREDRRQGRERAKRSITLEIR